MKQYCRYCTYLVTGNGIWCSVKKKPMSESTAKSINYCADFEFNEIDSFGETDGYKPRMRTESDYQQLSFDMRKEDEGK